jgi:hypothetical protein
MIGQASFHRGGNAQRLVYPAEIVVCKMQRTSGLQIIEFLRERIGQSRKPADCLTHGHILPLDKASRDVARVGPSSAERPNLVRLNPLAMEILHTQIHQLDTVDACLEGVRTAPPCTILIGYTPETLRKHSALGGLISRGAWGSLLRFYGSPPPSSKRLLLGTSR